MGAGVELVVVDDDLRAIPVTDAQLRRWRVIAWSGAGFILVLAVLLAFTVPRAAAFSTVVQENLVLKERIEAIDGRMSEVERLMLRLRLYDAQMRSLAEPDGDHGPLDPEDFANAGLPGRIEGGFPVELGAGEALTVLHPSDLRPAESWAESVAARVDTFLALFERHEPDLNKLMIELEDLRALEQALPTRWPADGTLTSGFGWRRNPIGLRGFRFHSGIDIAGPRGTAIYAPATGKVARAFFNSGYGNMIELDHGYGITTVYAHCTRMYVAEGEFVQRGDLIGTIGTTGRSTGPHLHFELRLDGHPVDPLDYLPR